MSSVIHVGQKDFEAVVTRSATPVVVDFYASWCPPCRALGPILDRLAGEFAGQVKFVKINSDEEPGLSQQFRVTGLPTLVFMDGGNNVGQFAGLPDEAALRVQLKKWVNSRQTAS